MRNNVKFFGEVPFMKNRLTGPQSFLRWAFPCAEYKLKIGRLTKEDFDVIEFLVKNRIRITPFHLKFLEACFPEAVANLRKHSPDPTRIWSRKIVDTVWQNHHNREGVCSVRKAIVQASADDMVQIILGGQTSQVSNTYDLPLKIGDEVFIHWNIIVKKV